MATSRRHFLQFTTSQDDFGFNFQPVIMIFGMMRACFITAVKRMCERALNRVNNTPVKNALPLTTSRKPCEAGGK